MVQNIIISFKVSNSWLKMAGWELKLNGGELYYAFMFVSEPKMADMAHLPKYCNK